MGSDHLWLHDLQADTATRLTSRGGRAPIWSDDGTIVYSQLGERQGIYSTRVDGGGEGAQLLALKAFHWLVGWTPGRAAPLWRDVRGQRIIDHRLQQHAVANHRRARQHVGWPALARWQVARVLRAQFRHVRSLRDAVS